MTSVLHRGQSVTWMTPGGVPVRGVIERMESPDGRLVDILPSGDRGPYMLDVQREASDTKQWVYGSQVIDSHPR